MSDYDMAIQQEETERREQETYEHDNLMNKVNHEFEEQKEITAYGVWNKINDHPAFQDYLTRVKPRDRTLSDAFDAGLKAGREEADDNRP